MLDLNRIDEAVRSEGGITRRLLLAYGAALAAIPTLGMRVACQPKGAVKLPTSPWTLGVTSGDPTEDSVVIWTRLAPHHLQADGGMPPENVEVDWVVANDDKFKDVVHKGTAVASARLGHSVHHEVRGLKPDRWYWFQFRCGEYESSIGRTRTMPVPDAMPEKLKLAFASCQHYEDGYYTAYEHMAKDYPDLVFHLGDYIYQGGATKPKGHPRRHVGEKPCRTLADYRIRHCQYRHDRDMHRIHCRCPWVVTWDDHDVENDYANDTVIKLKNVSPVEFLKQRAAGYQAYYEMMPLRGTASPKGPYAQMYRTISFGRLATFQVLDTRQYRTVQPNNDEPSDINAAALNPKNTQLGPVQKKWLEEELAKSNATWNVLAQQVMMGMVDPHGKREYSMDAWCGYAHERMKLIQYLADKRVSNPVILSGDKHSAWVNELRVDDRKQEGPPVAVEFVGTSITSKGNGTDVNPKAFQSINPFVKFHNDHRGYVRCTVTPKEWRSDFQIVREVEKAGGTAETAASFVVEAGKPGAVKA